MSNDFKDPAAQAETRLADEITKMIGEPFDRVVPWTMELTINVAELREVLVENARLRAQVTALQTRNTKLAEAERVAKRVGTAEQARTRRQAAVGGWVKRCFGLRSWTAKERTLRVVEEAIELAQAVGLEWSEVAGLAGYVYGRPVGDVRNEMSGVAVTLLALAECVGVSVDAVEVEEIERILALSEDFFAARYEKKIAAGVTTIDTAAKGTP